MKYKIIIVNRFNFDYIYTFKIIYGIRFIPIIISYFAFWKSWFTFRKKCATTTNYHQLFQHHKLNLPTNNLYQLQQ